MNTYLNKGKGMLSQMRTPCPINRLCLQMLPQQPGMDLRAASSSQWTASDAWQDAHWPLRSGGSQRSPWKPTAVKGGGTAGPGASSADKNAQRACFLAGTYTQGTKRHSKHSNFIAPRHPGLAKDRSTVMWMAHSDSSGAPL